MSTSVQFTVVIPARYSSERLPGKPLAMIAGKPMIQRVYERAQRSSATQVVVATDDERIVAAVKQFGGEVCLTSTEHPSGTDRIQEVAVQLGLDAEAIVVNVQGDEPLIPGAVIDQVAMNLQAHPQAAAATLCEPIENYGDFINPNIVKVVQDGEGLASYFSRAPIPWPRQWMGTDYAPNEPLPAAVGARRHIGIYAYRVALLQKFIQWSPAPLERTESLEQLRILAHGEAIHIADACEAVPGGIDTPEDLARINQQFAAQ